MNKLTHLDEHGAARMVDVSKKDTTEREATAEAVIHMSADAFEAVTGGTARKGDVIAAARIAGIMAAKKTSELIPLCHPIALSEAKIQVEPDAARCSIRIIACAKTTAQTGVEMEALTAACIAALTIYDMTKSMDKTAVIDGIRLLSKSGGKSGEFVAEPSKPLKQSKDSSGSRLTGRISTLVGEVVAQGSRTPPNVAREAFRTFMTSRHLRATQWAKDAGVPAAQIYAYLTGKVRSLPGDVAERLARAAKSRVEDMFR